MIPLDIDGLVAFWNFEAGSLTSAGPEPITLQELGQPLERVAEGPFGPHALRFTHAGNEASGYLRVGQDAAPRLGIGGADAQVTVMAWFKRTPSPYQGCQFIAGVWNEHHQRQYGLFLNLHIWNGNEQLGAHVSSHGGPTPGYPYCMDVALGATAVDFDGWHCGAMTYDGREARVYLDGSLDKRGENGEFGANPFAYAGGLHQGGADFTVGAVARPATVKPDGQGGFVEEGGVIANPFVGLLGGLAIYKRALSDSEIQSLSNASLSTV